MKRLMWMLLVSVAGAAILAQAQTVYRWVDKDGKVQYSDTPPPADAKSSQQKRFGGGTAVDEQVPYAVQMAIQKNPVSVYITGCGELCTGARELLAKRGIPYTERDPQNNTTDAEALRKLVGSLEVPVLVVGENSVKGFREASWNSALDAGGYPRVNPFTKAPAPKKSEAPKAPPPPAQNGQVPTPPPAQDGQPPAPPQ
jgi:glutaredoxin